LAAYMATVQAYGFSPAVLSALQTFTPPSSSVTEQLSLFTGISAQTLANTWGYLVTSGLYMQAFLPGNTSGRYDGRVSVPTNSQWMQANNDPSDEMVSPFPQQFQSYISNTLQYTDVAAYGGLNTGIIGQWNWIHGSNAINLPFMLDTIPDLQSALMLNPELKILSLNGYHDLATPYASTMQCLGRLGTQPNLTANFYEGGHMIYLNESSRVPMKGDISAFYAQTPTPVPTPGFASAVAAASAASAAGVVKTSGPTQIPGIPAASPASAASAASGAQL
jgi:carboxypeptidase C (cathepsin A)